MLVFIDDSGDAGFQLDKGASRYFVIAAVIFKDELEAEKTAVAIKEIKRLLKFPDNVEFKFTKSQRNVRIKFLQGVSKFDFKVRSIVIDKTLIRSKDLKNYRKIFYSYAIQSLLKHNGGSILNAKLRIDGSGDRLFRQSFVTYLRTQLNSRQIKVMKNCKLVDSKENVLIQMADMIAGSIKRSYDVEKPDAKDYKEIFKKHIEDEWQFK